MRRAPTTNTIVNAERRAITVRGPALAGPFASPKRNLHRQPGSIGRETPRGEMVQAHAVLEVADGVLDLGVAAVVSLQFQGVAVPVSDEGVIAVVGEEGEINSTTKPSYLPRG